MSQFIVEEPFWKLFPEVRIALIRVTGIDNHDHGQYQLQSWQKPMLTWPIWFQKNPSVNHYYEWREAFRKFKTKKALVCGGTCWSDEKGNPVRSIDPLVDLYNACSLRTGYPIGSMDTLLFMAISVWPLLRWQPFKAIGEDDPEPALPGEVIIKTQSVSSAALVLADAERVETREDTTATMYIECLKPEWQADHEAAINRLTGEIEQYLGAKTKRFTWILITRLWLRLVLKA